MTERELYLERVLQTALKENGDLQKVAEEILHAWIVPATRSIAGKDAFTWYEEHIFNESRLYQTLGKDGARSVLSVWELFKEICVLFQTKHDAGKKRTMR